MPAGLLKQYKSTNIFRVRVRVMVGVGFGLGLVLGLWGSVRIMVMVSFRPNLTNLPN